MHLNSLARRYAVLALGCLLLSGCGGQPLRIGGLGAAHSDNNGAASTCPAAIGDAATADKPALSVTHGQVALSGGAVAYTTTAGYLPLYAPGTQTGAIRGCLFFFAYTRDDHAGDRNWPLAFVFNGGPGAPSEWQHLGGQGPKTLNFGPEGITPGAATLADDPNTLLAYADLVFIDPIGTGYSRPASGVDLTQFDGLDADAGSIGDFIQGYVAQFGRAASPKYLVGESYSGMRLPVLGRYLDEKLGMKMTGIAFLSPWMDAIADDVFGITDQADDIPYTTYLPEYATIAWYHQKLAPDLQEMTLEQVYAAAQTFADTTYLDALSAGDDLPADQKAKVAADLSRFSSLDAAAWSQANLRLSLGDFRNGVLKSAGQVVGYYDGRMQGTVANPGIDDPYDAFDPLFKGAEAGYFSGTLGIQTDLPYATNNWQSWPGANASGSIQGEYLGVLDDIDTLLANNPDLKVYVASGLYDLVCPAAEVQYLLRHLKPETAQRIKVGHYPAGHPIYFGSVAHAQFNTDLGALMGSAHP
jgi:carboxypeptidase C (cathepsin A)